MPPPPCEPPPEGAGGAVEHPDISKAETATAVVRIPALAESGIILLGLVCLIVFGLTEF
jgi:hypothetical protein